MATVRTFILAPNYHQKPASSSIQLGSLIADPLKPTKPLSLPHSPAVIESVVQTAHTLSRSDGNSTNVGLSTNFLSFIGTSIGKSKGVDVTQSFEISVLETRYLRDEPNDDDPELLGRLQEPKVQAAIRAGLYGARPVYLISGLKVARGLTVQREEKKTRGGVVGATIPIVQGLSLGAELGGEQRGGTSTSFKVAEEDEVIFAYQVHKVKPKSRKAGKFTVNILETDAAFLHDEEERENSGGVEVTPLDLESVKEDEDEESTEILKGLEVISEANERYIYII